MSYRVIQPPFNLKFWEMSKRELKDYFTWFQNIMSDRIAELERTVSESPGFENWRADCKQESLNQLGDWFAAQIETEPRSRSETTTASQSPYAIDLASEDLTIRTFSLAVDVGMYLSQVFIRTYPQLRWEQGFRSKSSVDFGQPVLTGFGRLPFNPVRMLVTLAYGIANGKEGGRSLRELYDIWARMI